MFAPRYFAPRYFAPRYFAPGGDIAPQDETLGVNATGDEVMRRRPHWSGRMYADELMEAWGRRIDAPIDIEVDGVDISLRPGQRPRLMGAHRRMRKRSRRIAAAHRMSLYEASQIAAELTRSDMAAETERVRAILEEDDLIEILIVADEL